MMDESKRFYDWLEQGAIFYVCGDASRMTVDVDKALHDIIAKEGGKSEEEAAAYVEHLRAEKRCLLRSQAMGRSSGNYFEKMPS